jgi:GPI mannosyltransferase 2
MRLYTTKILFRLMLPQAFLAVLAITNYHVQIISRLSSGLPVWYIIMASALLRQKGRLDITGKHVPKKVPKEYQRGQSKSHWSRPMLRWIIGYQIIQAILYGGFLPPA